LTSVWPCIGKKICCDLSNTNGPRSQSFLKQAVNVIEGLHCL
jgi:hypothetical protein